MGKIKVTASKYRAIKALCGDPKRDQVIAGRFGISSGTVRTIRNTKNFQAYQDRLKKYNLSKKERALNSKIDHIRNVERSIYRRSLEEIKREDIAGAKIVVAVGLVLSFVMIAALSVLFWAVIKGLK